MAQTNSPVKQESETIAAPETSRTGVFCAPRVDIYETAEEVVLLCDMPGAKPSDMDVRFEKGELSLSGKVAPRPHPGDILAEEYGIADFYRSFEIAPDIDSDKIAAEYRDGVLTIHLPKQEKVKPRRIAVKAG